MVINGFSKQRNLQDAQIHRSPARSGGHRPSWPAFKLSLYLGLPKESQFSPKELGLEKSLYYLDKTRAVPHFMLIFEYSIFTKIRLYTTLYPLVFSIFVIFSELNYYVLGKERLAIAGLNGTARTEWRGQN